MLGKGASGFVFLMEHIKTRQLFAGKRITPDEEEAKMVDSEENIGMTVRCIFVVAVVDTFATDPDKWVLMELCEGGTMREWLNELQKSGTTVSEAV
jgi:serine/threonine protein kinase